MKVISLSLLLLSSVCAHSATVAVIRARLGVIPVYHGQALSTGGYYIGVGSFATEPVVTEEWASMGAAVNAFNEFARSVSPTSGPTVGTITGEFTGGFTDHELYNGKEIYILVGNGSTKANSTEFAILKGSTAWTFTADVSAAESISVLLRDVTSFNTVLGRKVDVADPDAQDQVILGVVPETSSSLLVGLFAVGFMSRRRR